MDHENHSATPAWSGRKTPRRVIWIDRACGAGIRSGGLCVILAVLGICVFLVYVVAPLFSKAEVGEPVGYTLPEGSEGLLFAELDEYRSMGMAFYRSGKLSVFDGRTGRAIREERIVPEGESLRSFSRTLTGGHTALGLEGGKVLLARLDFSSRFLEPASGGDGERSPDDLALEQLPPGGSIPHSGGVAEKTPLGHIRLSELQPEIHEPVRAGGLEGDVLLVAYKNVESREVLAALGSDGKLVLCRITRKENLLEGKTTLRLKSYPLPYEDRGSNPLKLLLNSRGDQLYLAWEDGTLHRYDLRAPDEPVLAEKLDLCPGDAKLTAIRFMMGEQSILTGDSTGSCAAWFKVSETGQPVNPDGYRMVAAYHLEPQGGAVEAMGVSQRNKTFATFSAGGEIWMRHATSQKVLGKLDLRSDVARLFGASTAGAAVAPWIAELQITPKSDALFAVTREGQAIVWPFSSPHPETNAGTLFGKVWYEGYDAPSHTWQTSGHDDFEPKFGLVPLIFGTLKATFYALLFAVPVAILAAIYTSEFLSRRARAAVKPTIEMMASLPSVVLGFLAALVLAPAAENWVLSILFVFFAVPVAVVIAAYFWLFLPPRWIQVLDGIPRLAVTGCVFCLAVWAAFPIGARIEELFFLGDFRGWLSPPRKGSAAPFWALVFFVPSLGATFLAYKWWIQPRLEEGIVERSRFRQAAGQLLRGLAILTASVGASAALAALAQWLGFDPRDSIVGTYAQRNSLIVGFAMGFAVIPIIYTISEDALSAVPEHLRGAALGCGATKWQVAVRVIVPTATSGIFSAVMVGLGRAVGETMIVVMAAGNTPLIDVNPFTGLRALSATIAVELPEAVKDGTLYRTLFLSALVLFGMTFVINTVAEVVRMRFRKRAFEL